MPGWDETGNSYRFRLRDPDRFQVGSYRTKEIDKGVSMVLGRFKDQSTMTAQSLILSKSRFKNLNDAKKWLKDHGGPSEFEENSKEVVAIPEQDGNDVSQDEIIFKDIQEPEFKELKDIEIFAAGTWNGDTFTEEDLEQISETFQETKDRLRPFLKIGHSEKQTLLAHDELPSAGLMTNVRRFGRKLLADFVNVPKKIYELVKRKAFDKISAELFVNIPVDGKRHPFALKAAALLGGETPAVHDLNSIMNLFGAEGYAVVSGERYFNLESKEYAFKDGDFNPIDPPAEDTMSMEELTHKNEKLEAEIKTFQEENAGLEKEVTDLNEKIKLMGSEKEVLEKKYAELETERIERENKIRSENIDRYIDDMINAGKVLPAQKPFMQTMLKDVKYAETEKMYSIDEKEYESPEDIFKAFVDAGRVEGLNLEEKSEIGVNPGDEDSRIQAADKLSREKKISFKEAYLALSPGNKTDEEE